jgi:4-azaleucine resistance transporter AzlC
MTESTNTRYALREGFLAVAPLLVGVTPFGLAFGVAASQSVVGGGLGYATSLIIFAGAAQLATVQLFDAHAATAVVIATALVINSRHFMYSAALSPHFRDFPTAWRFALPYVMTDQAFAVSITRFQQPADARFKRWYFTGAALGLWVTWQLTTSAGVILGAGVPDTWSLDFAIPLVFLALLVPTITNRPGLLAALVGGGVALAGHAIPYNLGLIVGALSGIAAGVAAERVAA